MSDVVWVAIITTLVPAVTLLLKAGRDALAFFRNRAATRAKTAGEALTAKNSEIDALRSKYEVCRDDLLAAWRSLGKPENRS